MVQARRLTSRRGRAPRPSRAGGSAPPFRVLAVFLTPALALYSVFVVYPLFSALQYSLWFVELLDTRYRLLGTDQLVDAAYDPYLFVKNAYLQRRDYQLSQLRGGPTKSESDADKLLDEATKEEESEEPAPGATGPEQPKPDQPRSDQPR